MSALPSAAAATDLPAIGAPYEGGFYAGRFRIGDETFALIVAPKPEGEHEGLRWLADGAEVAPSAIDGRANCDAAIDTAGARPAAEFCRALRIGGHDDWYLPAKGELEILYRALKPGTGRNWSGAGVNPDSLPPGDAYTQKLPAQTVAEAFREGGPQAFAREWYWSSTEFSADDAWRQDFDGGGQYDDAKYFALRVRAVRKVLIS